MDKQRKFLLVVPLLVLPFITMAFWALGGGKDDTVKKNAFTQGLDTKLPEAQFKDRQQGKDKLAIYQQTSRDSINDGVSEGFMNTMGMIKPQRRPAEPEITTDDQTRLIQDRLTQLNKQISQPQTLASESHDEPETQNVRQLRKMMKTMDDSNTNDPEIQQLSKMLDKIQAIQNPKQIQAEPVKTEQATPFRAISAIVDGKQKVANGAMVRLKLTDTVTIKNQLLPKGQLLFGSCEITNQRLLLTITNIRLDNNIIPVNLVVFSQDGMPGIPAPEAELAGSASNGADNAIQSMQLLSMDQSIGAQAATGGVNAAKNLFSKKVRKIKVKLNDAYPVLLKINK